MSEYDEYASEQLVQHREGRLHLQVFEDVAQTTPEDISGKTFSAVIYNPENPTEVYARAVGSEQVEVTVETSTIVLIFPASTFATATWKVAEYTVDDITDLANPKPFLPPDQIRLKQAASPSVPTP
ncbi:hypothetical protein [Planctomyces sp. SH-PL14]|uniref:hypothetical protein n=1 Tax=Planctomyces sp. SH-PL14 TaxID=1632864 RepID=UPI00078E5C5B|nr:hypothetical protein [Planctomyces sp. SH-PL14]AMV16606.1 hypothetical protein VT03_01870 [Planctomyces sp. SH-PL14]